MSANKILSVTATDARTLLVLFGNGASPALTVDDTPVTSAAYTLAALGAPPFVVPSVIARVAYQETAGQMFGVTLTADIDLTPNLSYRLTETGITGIAVDAIHNVQTFLSRALNFPAGRSFELIEFIPRVDLDEDTSGQLRAFIACLQEPLNMLVNNVDQWLNILDARTAPENFVDLMLRDLGSPFVFVDTLTLTEKRRLVLSLVLLYQLKGTTLGCQTAIQFFMGMESEFIGLDSGLGNRLNARTAPTSLQFHYALSDAAADSLISPHVPLRIGSRRPWRFVLKIGTTVLSQTRAGSATPAAGGPLTAKQLDQAERILQIMKPCYEIQVTTGDNQKTGPRASIRAGIQDLGAGSVNLRLRVVPDVDSYIFWEGEQEGVNDFDASLQVPVLTTFGDSVATGGYTPSAGTHYWNGVAQNATYSTNGLLTNEVTNALTKPVLVATGALGKIHLSWGAITGATSYRIYRSTSAATISVLADNASTPIEISSDFTSYDDPQESGTTRFYIVTPVIHDSESFMSDEQNATAL